MKSGLPENINRDKRHWENYPDMVSEWREQIEALLGWLPQDRIEGPVEGFTSEGSLGRRNPQAMMDYLDELVQLLPHSLHHGVTGAVRA